LSAFAEDHGCKPGEGYAWWTLRSSKSEGGCFGGFRRRDEGDHGHKAVEASVVVFVSTVANARDPLGQKHMASGEGSSNKVAP